MHSDIGKSFKMYDAFDFSLFCEYGMPISFLNGKIVE